jgi:hypothetical protein
MANRTVTDARKSANEPIEGAETPVAAIGTTVSSDHTMADAGDHIDRYVKAYKVLMWLPRSHNYWASQK